MSGQGAERYFWKVFEFHPSMSGSKSVLVCGCMEQDSLSFILQPRDCGFQAHRNWHNDKVGISKRYVQGRTHAKPVENMVYHKRNSSAYSCIHRTLFVVSVPSCQIYSVVGHSPSPCRVHMTAPNLATRAAKTGLRTDQAYL
jgi:hypothetical protein